MVYERQYPSSVIAIERALILNKTSKRFDIVVFNLQAQPFLIIECKAPYIALNQAVAEQALRYNLVLKAPYVMISNGISDWVFDRNGSICDLPDAAELTV